MKSSGKKSNLITLLSLCVLIVAVVVFMFLWKTPSEDIADEKTENISVSEKVSLTESTKETETEKQSLPVSTEKEVQHGEISMSDALFIGDSRTVGLMEYGKIDGADFFCTVGMSVYNIHKEPVSVPNVGKVYLSELLDGKKYGKIYVMLGINEVGYALDDIVEKYGELLDFIKSKQPDAVIFVQANLHVSKSRSDSDKIVNNGAIDRLNNELSKLADGKAVFYLNANTVFDDENGGLASDKTEDNTHLYAKYYREWGEWIVSQTASVTAGEG